MPTDKNVKKKKKPSLEEKGERRSCRWRGMKDKELGDN